MPTVIHYSNPVRDEFKVSYRKDKTRKPYERKNQPMQTKNMNPQLWSVVKRLANGDFRRVEIISETEVVVYNTSDWNK